MDGLSIQLFKTETTKLRKTRHNQRAVAPLAKIGKIGKEEASYRRRVDIRNAPLTAWGASGGAGHGELPRKFLPHPGDAWRREAPGETPGNATETRPPTLDEDDAAR